MNSVRPSFRSTRSIAALAVALVVLFASASAHAGPPFQTDDPEPVDYRHFEMYAFELSDGTTQGGTTLATPAYEVNYGVVPNVQLHLVLPFTTVFAPDGPNQHGFGDTEFGIKLRFVKESKSTPQIGIFPFFEFPSGNADKGLGIGKTWYRMPLWLQKSWGPDDRQWTSYGGGGYTIVPQDGFVNFPFAGWLLQRQLSKKLTLGSELYGHGPRNTRHHTLRHHARSRRHLRVQAGFRPALRRRTQYLRAARDLHLPLALLDLGPGRSGRRGKSIPAEQRHRFQDARCHDQASTALSCGCIEKYGGCDGSYPA